MQRDSIDFGSMKVGQLFCKQLFPTLLGMVFSALFVITDGVFVGRGIGSDALAAVNIAAPLFVFAAGMGLMFGMGGAIVASINLGERTCGQHQCHASNACFFYRHDVSIYPCHGFPDICRSNPRSTRRYYRAGTGIPDCLCRFCHVPNGTLRAYFLHPY